MLQQLRVARPPVRLQISEYERDVGANVRGVDVFLSHRCELINLCGQKRLRVYAIVRGRRDYETCAICVARYVAAVGASWGSELREADKAFRVFEHEVSVYWSEGEGVPQPSRCGMSS